MIILNGSTRSLEAVLSGAVTTNELQFSASWADDATSPATGASYGDTNGTTPVTVVAAPSGSDRRVVRSLQIFNGDTVNATITVRVNDNSTMRVLVTITLQPGFTLHYGDSGWSVTDTTGLIQNSEATVTGATNLGAGEGLFTSLSTGNLQFKSLVAGTNITLTPSGTEITIDSSGGGGGGLTWTTTGTGATMAAGNGYVVTAAVTMTLPASLTAGDEIIVHASGADVTVDPATHSIEGAGATVTSSDTLTVEDGQTAHMVAETTSLMRIV